MQKQLGTLNYQQRKKLYDRVQEVLAQQLPMIYLVSPNILVGAQENLGNFHPAIIEQYTFWNADELFGTPPPESSDPEATPENLMEENARELTLPTVRDAGTAEDERLVQACLSGDEKAWNTLIDKYKRLILFRAGQVRF